ncbi:hypothetical protein DITRI_Ditri04bG0080800 [Diplodiscus trichospermus]
MGCWWVGVEDSRLLIAPDPGANGDGSARLLSLRHPKSDGSLYTATPIDPVFIMLPMFEEARMTVTSFLNWRYLPSYFHKTFAS